MANFCAVLRLGSRKVDAESVRLNVDARENLIGSTARLFGLAFRPRDDLLAVGASRQHTGWHQVRGQ
jgi:hypothetical protein